MNTTLKTEVSVAGRRWAAVSDMLAQNDIETLVVHGAPLVGSYGNFAYLTGATPAPKGSVVVMQTGSAPAIVHQRGDATWRDAPRYDGIELHAVVDVPSHVADLAMRSRTGVAGGALGGHLPSRAVGVDADLARLRQELTTAELVALDSSVALAHSVITAVCETLRPGVQERQVAAALTGALIAEGATMILTHVAHADYCGQAPSARELQPNELTTIVVEFADCNGFWVEAGTVFGWLGASPYAAQMTADANTLRRCLDAGQQQLFSGRALGDAGAAMIAELADAQAFPIERLGHGVAIDEVPPDVTVSSADVIRPGSVFALHPSLGRRGTTRCAGLFRMVAVTTGGSRVLGSPDFAECVLR